MNSGEELGKVEYIEEVAGEEGEVMEDMSQNYRQSKAPSDMIERLSIESQGKQGRKKPLSAITSPVQDGNIMQQQ